MASFHFLELATDSIQEVQRLITAGPTGSGGAPEINYFQCLYVSDKLSKVVTGAKLYHMNSTSEHGLTCEDVFKNIYRVAKDIETYVRNCCNKKSWMQAALMMIDSSEQLSLWAFELEVYASLLRNSEKERAVLDTFAELKQWSTRDAETRLVQDKAILDHHTLLSKLNFIVAQDELPKGSNNQEQGLAIYLSNKLQKIDTLGSQIANIDSICQVEYKDLHRVVSIGKGSFATVYKTTWLGHNFAEKVYPGADYEIFKKEASLLSGLSHPNIVPLICCVVNDRNYSLVMELMDKDLRSLMDERLNKRGAETKKSTPFDLPDAVDIMLQIAEGMLYLHQKRILHRDLKSLNILVKCAKDIEGNSTSNDVRSHVHAKVTDFGLSKTKQSSCTSSCQTPNVGTTRWLAPELMSGSQMNQRSELKFHFKSDVYSYGMICYEILTGNVPFPNITLNEVRGKVLGGVRPEIPMDLCPSGLAALIKDCWRSNPRERPSFDEICVELRQIKCLFMLESTSSISRVDKPRYRLDCAHDKSIQRETGILKELETRSDIREKAIMLPVKWLLSYASCLRTRSSSSSSSSPSSQSLPQDEVFSFLHVTTFNDYRLYDKDIHAAVADDGALYVLGRDENNRAHLLMYNLGTNDVEELSWESKPMGNLIHYGEKTYQPAQFLTVGPKGMLYSGVAVVDDWDQRTHNDGFFQWHRKRFVRNHFFHKHSSFQQLVVSESTEDKYFGFSESGEFFSCSHTDHRQYCSKIYGNRKIPRKLLDLHVDRNDMLYISNHGENAVSVWQKRFKNGYEDYMAQVATLKQNSDTTCFASTANGLLYCGLDDGRIIVRRNLKYVTEYKPPQDEVISNSKICSMGVTRRGVLIVGNHNNIIQAWHNNKCVASVKLPAPEYTAVTIKVAKDGTIYNTRENTIIVWKLVSQQRGHQQVDG